MKSKYFYPNCILFCLILCAISGIAAGAQKQSYTATALIKVLPYADTDPIVIGTPNVDREKQKEFRHSLVILMEQQNWLTDLTRRDRVKKTEWFKSFGEEQAKAVEDLQKNLNVTEVEGTDFIEVAMTCSQPEEAALIANEMVDIFFASQTDRRIDDIRKKLVELEARRRSVEQNLDLAYRAMDDVRKSSGFGDLDIREYRHPVEERVIRLTNIVDNLKLDIAYIEGFEKEKASVEYDKETKRKIAALTSKLQTAQQLLEQAKMENARLDAARMQHQQRIAIRDQLIETLNDIKKLIEKYRILAEDPDTIKIQKVGSAAVPLETG